jgi:hypothetical protein
VEQDSISGQVDWQEKNYSIASGSHTLKWEYEKDASLSAGSDAGWLDMVSYKSLGEAVDNTILSWSTAGDADWLAQTAVSYSDGDAAQSGDIGDNQESSIETTVLGPITLKYYWKVSSEQDYDFLKFYIDGVEQDSISGEVDWQEKNYSIAAGSHTLKWEYVKDINTSLGSDAGWLDNVSYTLPSNTLSVTSAGTGTGTVISDLEGIACGADCTEDYTSGQEVTLMAIPASGSTFAGWSGAECSGTEACTINMNAAKNVVATFISRASLSSGLAAYYPFNGNANDESGNNNNGIVYGASLTTDRFGNANSAYDFNGSSSYIRVPRSGSLDLTGPVTMTAWIYPRNVSGLTAVVEKETSATGYNVHLDGGKLHVRIDGSSMSVGTVSSNTSYLVAGVYDGTKIKAYINGVNVGEVNESLPTGIAGKDLYIGSFEGGRLFNGVIDEVRIYNRALSVDELQALYVEANVFVSPNSHDFGVINTGDASNTTFTITNTGTLNLTTGRITITGTNSDQFSIEYDDCSHRRLAPSDTCTFQNVFSPTSAGAKTASLDIPSDDPDTPVASAALSGTGCDTQWYKDADNDGYSDGTTQTACTRPADYKLASELTAISGDCDDGSNTINPLTYWYLDSDGDGYGTSSAAMQQCAQPSGYVLDNTDCSDSDQYLYPGGPEVRIVSPLTYYSISQLQTAYNSAGSGANIQSKVATYTGNFTAGQSKTVTIKGGYDCSFTTNSGTTIINGNMTINNGTAIIEGIKVQ